MPAPLAEGWLQQLAAELASVDLESEGIDASDGVVQVLVGNAPLESGALAGFYVEASDGCLSVHARRHRRPDMVLSGDYRDFLLVWQGELTLEAAYMSGRMKLEGDQVLLFDRWRPLLRSRQLREAWERLR
ncbi:MAG: SCP2 sterol-binding domain-containing protein [Acidimicrobiaceae bacterium]|nr:SCP2 sterol-binding domain-containing protein [Acidimicrobiaceae bacterium]MCY4174943.1 SCP2 sterol-binding domain-containing protein [Acidimicrobiaceae bacterium]MCY4279504.1 SCP2 sterol-binding domain-containing protein [Acidimicrobiaceae bacterium]MCY4294472.1 SCP2 sterol-binding domain-containing protein [Acidimicrobiaceae bacterium]